MLWRLFQSVIVVGFLMWNAGAQWTPNPLVPAILGLIVAELLTAGISKLLDWRRRLVPVLVGHPTDDQVGDDRLRLGVSGGELSDLPKLLNRLR
jgi:hypothetical protein